MANDKAQARNDFVKARLQATGKEATPEQRAKFRERFNTLSQSMEGRTKIAQTVLPGGTATERATLKKLLKPSGTASTTTTPTTPSVTTPTTPSGNPYGGSAPYVPKGTKPGTSTTTTTIPGSTTATTIPRTTGTIAGGTVPAGNSATSAVVPGAKKTQDFTNPTMNFLLSGLPGTQSWRDKGINVGVADIPLGIGKLVTGLKKAKEGNFLGALGNVVAGGVELGFSLRSGLKSKSSFPNTQITPPNTQITPPSAVTKFPTVSTPVRTVQQAASSYNPNAVPVVSGVSGANRPTSMPVVPNFRGTTTPPAPIKSPAPTKASKTPTATTVPKPTATTVPMTAAEKAAAAARNRVRDKNEGDYGGKPTTAVVEAPQTPAGMKAAGSKSTAVTVPKSTTPTTVVAGRSGSVYDGLGTRTTGSYKDPGLGDPMPTKPSMPRGLSKGDKDLWKQSDAMLDYENALYAWQKYNKKP